MRNFLLLLAYMLPIALFGQNKVPFDIAMDHLKKQAIIWQIDPADYEGSMISSEATNQDITYLYLNQAYIQNHDYHHQLFLPMQASQHDALEIRNTYISNRLHIVCHPL